MQALSVHAGRSRALEARRSGNAQSRSSQKQQWENQVLWAGHWVNGGGKKGTAVGGRRKPYFRRQCRSCGHHQGAPRAAAPRSAGAGAGSRGLQHLRIPIRMLVVVVQQVRHAAEARRRRRREGDGPSGKCRALPGACLHTLLAPDNHSSSGEGMQQSTACRAAPAPPRSHLKLRGSAGSGSWWCTCPSASIRLLCKSWSGKRQGGGAGGSGLGV